MSNSGKTSWRSPSNIALVKYWGKKGIQMPVNPSVSMTLEKCYSETSITWSPKNTEKKLSFTFLFEGKENKEFASKIKGFLQTAIETFPALQDLHFDIESSNSFPHSAGIASSASALSSLALCLCDIHREVSNQDITMGDFYQQASDLSRLGSGSACRSVYGNWVLWGHSREIEGSSDMYAIPLGNTIDPLFEKYYDSILIVSSAEKPVKSSRGHSLMKSNPFNEIRAETGKLNTLKLLDALNSGNELTVRDISEFEAANLHAMFLTSTPSFKLIKPGTDAIIEALMRFRKETGVFFFYTLDAGPNIHLLYPQRSRDKILPFIQSELAPLCEEGKWIDDRIGKGPEKVY